MMQKKKSKVPPNPPTNHRWGRITVTESVRDQPCPAEVGVLEGKYSMAGIPSPATSSQHLISDLLHVLVLQGHLEVVKVVTITSLNAKVQVT